jgi:hypothetical protein
MLQRQPINLNGRKLDRRHAYASYIFRQASPCPMLRTCSFSLFCMTLTHSESESESESELLYDCRFTANQFIQYITFRQGPHWNAQKTPFFCCCATVAVETHRFQQFLYCCVLIRCCGDIAQIVSMGTCFVCEAHYPVTALVYLLTSRSSSTNGSTRYNIIVHMTTLKRIQFVFICYIKKTPWFLARKRTIPTERPQPAGEVSANFSW